MAELSPSCSASSQLAQCGRAQLAMCPALCCCRAKPRPHGTVTSQKITTGCKAELDAELAQPPARLGTWRKAGGSRRRGRRGANGVARRGGVITVTKGLESWRQSGKPSDDPKAGDRVRVHVAPAPPLTDPAPLRASLGQGVRSGGNWKYLGALAEVLGDDGGGRRLPGESGLVGHDAPPAHTAALSSAAGTRQASPLPEPGELLLQ